MPYMAYGLLPPMSNIILELGYLKEVTLSPSTNTAVTCELGQHPLRGCVGRHVTRAVHRRDSLEAVGASRLEEGGRPAPRPHAEPGPAVLLPQVRVRVGVRARARARALGLGLGLRLGLGQCSCPRAKSEAP